ncbi:MAG: DUF2157 domain-containing protein [Bryobacteraceae bacterium]
MRSDWESRLESWMVAGVVDAATAGRIRDWESGHARPQGLRWPIWIALVFGALMLGAGVFLFVSAHWDELSPGQRMTLVLVMVGAFHIGGAAAAGRFEWLSVALHSIGTLALGAGIALAGQIFNLSEHWPAAVMLWAAGAALAWVLLRHWTQAAFTAILVPYWLSAEWWVRMHDSGADYMVPIAAGICALSFTYLSARRAPGDDALRQALGWLGGIALLPAAFATAMMTWHRAPAWREQWVAWLLAILLPLAIAILLRGLGAWWNAVAIAWTLLLVAANGGHGDRVLVYLWCAVGAVGLAAWGIHEARPARINLAIAGFAITVLLFYFSNVMDQLSRSGSLMALGILFLGGGYLVERARRRLIAQIRPEAS